MKGVVNTLSIVFRYSIFFKSLKIGFRLLCSPFYLLFSKILNLFFKVITVENNKNLKFLANNIYFFQKKKWSFLKKNRFFFILDLVYLNFLSFAFKIDNNSNSFNLRIRSRLSQVSWTFYNNLHSESKNPFKYTFIHYLSGLRYLWVGLKYWVLGLVVGLLTFYFLTYIRLLPFNKIIFEWVLLIMFFYWLISGFVFFIKKYQYSKFTSVIQRFWKRSYILFWTIESGVFLVFFYLTLNASEEPFYMYDQIKMFKTHLFSWRAFLIKLVPVITLILLSYYLVLSLKWTTFSKQTPVIVAITLTLVYVFWLEFYQFFHIISYYGSLIWSYDSDEFLWNLDIDFKRTRIVNNVTTICLLAKFWHLVFIFLFWIFFVLRINEIGRVRYPLLGANLQNFIILYLMSWLYMYPWVKFAFRRHLETSYYWFFYNARHIGIRVLFNDVYLFMISLLNSCTLSTNFYFSSGSFFYWLESSKILGSLQYKKFIIRDSVIFVLNSNASHTNISTLFLV